MIKLQNVKIDHCGGGIRSDVPIQADDLEITHCGKGMELTGRASQSSFRNTQISECDVAVIVREVVGIEPEESQVREIEEIRKRASSKDDLIEKLKRSGVGRYLAGHKLTDWMRLAEAIWPDG